MMELDEFLEVSTLLDYYKNLLSDKQREYLINHFEDDLSLSEIAKNNDVSRQAVYDNSNFFTVMQVILGGIIRTLRTQQDILNIHMIQENSVNLAVFVWYGIGT